MVTFAIVGDQDFQHVHHASLLMVRCSFQSPLERGCNPQIKAITFDVVKIHIATQMPVQLVKCIHLAGACLSCISHPCPRFPS